MKRSAKRKNVCHYSVWHTFHPFTMPTFAAKLKIPRFVGLRFLGFQGGESWGFSVLHWVLRAECGNLSAASEVSTRACTWVYVWVYMSFLSFFFVNIKFWLAVWLVCLLAAHLFVITSHFVCLSVCLTACLSTASVHNAV